MVKGKVRPGKVNFAKIEKKWQNKWEKNRVFEVKESKKKKKYYVLDMFPYPSGEGLHMGNAFVYSLGDIFARFKRMQGFNVLYPIGYDALGLPAENAAIKAGTHPFDYTKKSIANFMKQQKAMGWSYDWSRLVNTSNPEFYKWDQWIFLKMLEKGIAYRKKAPVNWCPECRTVLANEQVHNGKCWRHANIDVEIKHLEQWFLKITDYADDLLKGLEKIKWPERAKIMQKNWIGKSYGTEIIFEVNNEKWPIFTTRPDTIYGVTFMVISAQHSKLAEIVTEKQKPEVEKFLKKIKSVSEKEMRDLEKEGVFTGSYAINPINNEKVPIWVGNFVVADYGSGMVMAVPAHDQRDYEFARKYYLPIKEVIKGGGIIQKAYVDEGIMINSDEFNGLDSRKAIDEISKYLEKRKLGKKAVEYKLKDWLVSRQRYWGTPIPIIYCDKCGIVPVPEKQLPVELPKKVKFGKGNPLKTNKNFVNVKCPKCNGKAKRETDTMDTFVNSSWYYLRYCDTENNKEIFNKKKVNYWCPIDQYIGGPEHITMHLIYTRFYTKFLKDLGLIKFNEPALKYFTQGIVKGSDGEKMSKSKGNVVEPIGMIEKCGADALRWYLVSNAAPDKDFVWNDEAVEGSYRFIKKVMEYFSNVKTGRSNKKIESKYNGAIKEVAGDIENFRYNLAVIKIRELFDKLGDRESKEVLEGFLKMFSVFCPHLAEELWSKFGKKTFISKEKWPKADLKKIDKNLEKQEEQIDDLIEDILNILKILDSREEKRGNVTVFATSKNAKVFAIPKEVELYKSAKEDIEKSIGISVEILSIKNVQETGKKIKAKPGKPGILIE